MDKMRQWTLLTVVGVIAVLGAGWFAAVSPQRHHAASLRTQTETQMAANNVLQQRVNQLEQQKKGLPAQQRRLNQIAAKIPDNPALPALIRQLSTAANSAGVDLVSLSPSQPSVVQPTTTTSLSSTSTAAASASTSTSTSSGSTHPVHPAGAESLVQISVSIVVQGSYYNIESFFSAVEKLQRAVLIPGWQVSLAQGAGTVSAVGAGSSSPAKTLPPDTLKGQINAVVFESPAPVAANTK